MKTEREGSMTVLRTAKLRGSEYGAYRGAILTLVNEPKGKRPYRLYVQEEGRKQRYFTAVSQLDRAERIFAACCERGALVLAD